jgi:hypothetical protein
LDLSFYFVQKHQELPSPARKIKCFDDFGSKYREYPFVEGVNGQSFLIYEVYYLYGLFEALKSFSMSASRHDYFSIVVRTAALIASINDAEIDSSCKERPF